ncbi:undecaprenyl-phosphate galactose phosphotransferase WbaP [Rahnella victoriana]|uniref:Undecaprenyl-phosphate galactose phosphotransferase WbaP n=1 Tax=Rahnella victoriana TaxID=1510570 RepID=A0ABS0DRJ5_9GAMM|nr:undecaprenyl-phosphate galactose phosphotransferase WbaP [Rahnella victoriana]MBF7956053.1 undecaprenyl-phosphate galactose phosphotransferase WbaP [Rahnella victoriana]TBX31475.1 undecaprenyl-phosphate galactose phosphotransferase WbaP [Rahnella victoriana]
MSNINARLRSSYVQISLALSDFVFFNLSLYFSVMLIEAVTGNIYRFIPQKEMSGFYLSHFLLSLICIGWFWGRLRHYSYRKPFWFELKETMRTLLIFAVINLAVVGFSKWGMSRYVWAVTWLLAMILVPVARHVVKKILNRMGLWQKQTIIIGNGPNACDAFTALQSEEVLGFDVVAFYAVNDNSETHLINIPILKDEAELWSLIDKDETQFIVAVEFDQHAVRDYWLKNLAKHHCRSVSVIPTLRGVPLYSTDMSFIFSHDVMILRVNYNLVKRSSRVMKRLFDIVGSLSIMLLLSPVLLTLIYLVSRDGGKPIYSHQRVGRNGKKFGCLKFRSMVLNSKEILENLLANDPEARAEWNKDFKLKNDPRITKIGHFIRKTSLDELPQLWNVLKGEMSLVGPRPIIESELERYEGEVDYYLMAKPGMTGLWQVSGRNDVDYSERVYFDAWYVKNWSIWNDIAILFKTVKVVLKRDGAY